MFLADLKDITEDLKKPMIEFNGRFFLSRSPTEPMPNIERLSQKFFRQDKGEFDEILAVLKGKLQL